MFLSWRNEAHTLRFNAVKSLTGEQIREQLEKLPHILDPLSETATYRWFCEAEGVVVGSVSLSNVNLAMGLAEIGYMFGEKYYGRGYGTEFTRLWVAKIFAETPLRKLTALVAEENIPSNRLLQKIGFTREGLLREHFIIQGRAVSEVAWGLLRAEWKS